MTRQSLDWCARPNTKSYRSTFCTVVSLFVFVFITQTILNSVKKSIIAAANPEAGDVEKLEIPASASLLESVRSIIDSSFGVYLFIIIIRTRSFIRRQSSIPEKNCGACEDFCCACCCSCCATMQMARHTTEYDNERAICCSSTGLSVSMPRDRNTA